MEMRIAIPTDFSLPAEKAALYTLELFRDMTCTFFLVHTYTPSFFRAEYLLHSPGQIGLGDFYQQRVLDTLEAFKARLKAKDSNPRHRFMIHAAFNSLDAELHDMVGKEDLDLIAMGTQGATGAKEVLLGTHATLVAHKAGVPVLIIPEQARVAALEEVLFPADYKADYARLPLQVLRTLLQQAGARLHILHTYTPRDQTEAGRQGRQQLEEALKGVDVHWHEQEEDQLVSAINHFARQQPIQLLVLVRNPHTFLENLLVTPLIDQIGFHTRIPLLVLPPA
ncbi:universal stress protein [Robiginitalea sp. M366]|uniref:universal stress protein n=1 Tax=Robiginitalea aestuariiviva TaxID=3036903 RepID=UPI00240E40FB|nr:universal stress protein [Robiginitalea aestuariiviva]MDG1572447.1 universal stress protein [Robiginitalea aestuariiviva]